MILRPGCGSGPAAFRHALFGEPVGGGDEVVRAGLLDHVVLGELPEARHDLGGRRLPDGLGDVVEVAVEVAVVADVPVSVFVRRVAVLPVVVEASRQ